MPDEGTIEVPHELMRSMPENLAERMCKQMHRWFGVEAVPGDLRLLNFRVNIDDRTPPEWMLLFESLRAGNWNAVELALEQLRKVRPETIKKRTVSATLSTPGDDHEPS